MAHSYSNYDELFEKALSSENPFEELKALAFVLHEQGHKRAQIVEIFTAYGLKVRKENREKVEDHIPDILDFITGYCHPSRMIQGLD